MIRRTYIIKGFDCAHCAMNVEKHLNKNEKINSAIIDFAGDRLHVVYEKDELSEKEILDIIKEVENDEITLTSLDDKKKKTYIIKGFDCAHCASKAEAHLNKDERVEQAVIDFAKDRLHISFKGKALTIEEIKAIIGEVEDDEIEIAELTSKREATKVFDKDSWITLVRVILSTALLLVARIAFPNPDQFWIAFSLYLI